MLSLKINTSRWTVLFADILISASSITIAFLLRFNFAIPDAVISSLKHIIPIVLFIRLISFLLSGLYKVIVKHTSTEDAKRIFIVVALGSFSFFIINLINLFVLKGSYFIPTVIIIIDFLVTLFLMTLLRLVVKLLYLEINNPNKLRKNVVIYGSGQLALITKRTLDRDTNTGYKVISFLDTKKKNIGKILENVRIYGLEKFKSILDKNSVAALIIAEKINDSNIKDKIIELCLDKNVKILTVPEVSNWINGELSVNQIKNCKIEDLLERDPIILDEKQIRSEILNKTILVTGAAGSIGSELVKQISTYKPKLIVLFDQAESPLYDIQMELSDKLNFHNFEVVIGDIVNVERIKNVFETFKPDIVFHAAAYKHVPMMEDNPSEAIRINVFGTKNVAERAVKNKVSKFIMISTDKAVNPTNVMGASKRIAEIFIQSLDSISETSFVTTRFGNVLGSNGSVIPRFRQQIEDGGPVTVTHPEVTRYFMTIPEACQLVLEASALGKGGEIYIFDMGKSVKIADLAKKMIKLSGLKLGQDIQIIFTGLRPGEKLYEELLNDKENTIPTHHPQIMIAKEQKQELKFIIDKIEELKLYRNKQDNFALVSVMKSIIPEFISKNSRFEELDIQNVSDEQN